MKKLLILSLALLLLFTGCSNAPDTETQEATENDSEEISEIVVESDTETEEPEETTATETSPPELLKLSANTPWHLSFEKQDLRDEIPEEFKNIALKVPLIYEEIVHGVVFQVEFFQEYYLLDGPIQAKISITNLGKEDFLFHSNVPIDGFLRADDREYYSSLPFNYHYYPPVHQIGYYSAGYYIEEDIKLLPVSVGETVVFERAYLPYEWEYGQPICFFELNTEYVFSIKINAYATKGYTIPSAWEDRSITIKFPIEVVEVERVD